MLKPEQQLVPLPEGLYLYPSLILVPLYQINPPTPLNYLCTNSEACFLTLHLLSLYKIGFGFHLNCRLLQQCVWNPP